MDRDDKLTELDKLRGELGFMILGFVQEKMPGIGRMDSDCIAQFSVALATALGGALAGIRMAYDKENADAIIDGILAKFCERVKRDADLVANMTKTDAASILGTMDQDNIKKTIQ